MNKKDLLSTKRKLTIIFTLLVFSVALFLQFSFFSLKYIWFTKVEKESMAIISANLKKRNIPIGKIWLFFRPEKQFLWGRKWNKHIRNDRIEEWKFMNFIVLNGKNEILSQDIKSDIDLKAVEWVFTNWDGTIVIDSWIIVSIIEYKNNYKLILFKKVRYSLSDYSEDIFYFTLIIILFSLLFYYLGFRFVSRNLQPVEESLADMRDFIHNAWHELKTPISIIHSNLQLMKESKNFEKDLIKEWLREAKRLDHLIESLIELSNINNNSLWEKLDITAEIAIIIKEFKGESDKKKIKINFNIKNEKYMIMNKQYFYILFSNLFWNAIKYTSNWWTIDIVLEKSKLIISDSGIWIKKSDQEKIFHRFYQSDNSRWTTWFGIWLSLVKKIADIYRWRILVKSEEGKGSRFIVEF
jgi:signal transduction histidine kinase